ncbi:hypothetical protein EJ08DRAFT_702889 [Tothia fuscella]|uniref:Uncharacterized protein n=1 Tax=Tothia fuscella TaxID=1048955 RepID=A0A9P4NFK0_9PEZI|nr:hypothetical protein EJ08DRAFT_702889 [Tothia fuscella]
MDSNPPSATIIHTHGLTWTKYGLGIHPLTRMFTTPIPECLEILSAAGINAEAPVTSPITTLRLLDAILNHTIAQTRIEEKWTEEDEREIFGDDSVNTAAVERRVAAAVGQLLTNGHSRHEDDTYEVEIVVPREVQAYRPRPNGVSHPVTVRADQDTRNGSEAGGAQPASQPAVSQQSDDRPGGAHSSDTNIPAHTAEVPRRDHPRLTSSSSTSSSTQQTPRTPLVPRQWPPEPRRTTAQNNAVPQSSPTRPELPERQARETAPSPEEQSYPNNRFGLTEEQLDEIQENTFHYVAEQVREQVGHEVWDNLSTYTQRGSDGGSSDSRYPGQLHPTEIEFLNIFALLLWRGGGVASSAASTAGLPSPSPDSVEGVPSGERGVPLVGSTPPPRGSVISDKGDDRGETQGEASGTSKDTESAEPVSDVKSPEADTSSIFSSSDGIDSISETLVCPTCSDARTVTHEKGSSADLSKGKQRASTSKQQSEGIGSQQSREAKGKERASNEKSVRGNDSIAKRGKEKLTIYLKKVVKKETTYFK